MNEVNRVTGVLNGHLGKQKSTDGEGKPWLVGRRYSYADAAFVTWQAMVVRFATKDEYDVDRFPHVKEWLDNLTGRSAIKKVMEDNDRAQEKIRARTK